MFKLNVDVFLSYITTCAHLINSGNYFRVFLHEQTQARTDCVATPVSRLFSNGDELTNKLYIVSHLIN